MQAEGLPEGASWRCSRSPRRAAARDLDRAGRHAARWQQAEQLDRAATCAGLELLDEAGWTVGDDGMRRNGRARRCSVEFLDDNPTFDRIINPYVENLRRLGVDARYDHGGPGAGAAAPGRLRLRHRARPLRHGPRAPRWSCASGSVQSRGREQRRNFMGLADPAVDRLIERVDRRREPRGARRRGPRARPGAARQALLGAAVVQGQYLVAYYDMYGHPETRCRPTALGRSTSGGSTPRTTALEGRGRLALGHWAPTSSAGCCW